MELCIKCGRTLCPKCGAHCETGYGVAFGGGLGSYEWCPGAACNWFTKRHDPEDEPPEAAQERAP